MNQENIHRQVFDQRRVSPLGRRELAISTEQNARGQPAHLNRLQALPGEHASASGFRTMQHATPGNQSIIAGSEPLPQMILPSQGQSRYNTLPSGNQSHGPPRTRDERLQAQMTKHSAPHQADYSARESIAHQRRVSKSAVQPKLTSNPKIHVQPQQVLQVRTITPQYRPSSSLRQPAAFLEQAGIGQAQPSKPTMVCPHHGAGIQYVPNRPGRDQGGVMMQARPSREVPALNVSSGRIISHQVRVPHKKENSFDFRALGKGSSQMHYNDNDNTLLLSSIEHAASHSAEQTHLQLEQSVPHCFSNCESPASAGELRRNALGRRNPSSPSDSNDRGGEGVMNCQQDGADTREENEFGRHPSWEAVPGLQRVDTDALVQAFASECKRKTKSGRREDSSGPSTHRGEAPGLHAREVSFQQIGASRGLRQQTGKTDERPRRAANTGAAAELGKFGNCSRSPESPERKPEQINTGHLALHRASGSAEHLALYCMRSHQSSQRSRSLDLGVYEHRSAEGQSSQKRHHSLRKDGRVKAFAELEHNYARNLNEDSAFREAHEGEGLGAGTEYGQAPQSDPRMAQVPLNSSPRFSHQHQPKVPGASGPMNIVDRSRPSQRGHRAGRESQESNPCGQPYVTPSHSQLSDGRAEPSRRRAPRAQPMNLADGTDDEMVFSNMNFNTQDLIQMYSGEEEASRASADLGTAHAWLRGGTSTASAEPAWHSGLTGQQARSQQQPAQNRGNEAAFHASHDDTFRGENFVTIQQSFGEGGLSHATTISNVATTNLARRQPATLSERRGGEASPSTRREYEEDEADLVQANEYLALQVHCLNQKYARLKFTELAEKLWLRQKLQKVHENLAQAAREGNKSQPAKSGRVDAYMTLSTTSNARTSLPDLVAKIKRLAKQLRQAGLGQAPAASCLHQASRGLSKLSDIDSEFRISGVSPRGAPTAHQSTSQPGRGRAGRGAHEAQEGRDPPSPSTFRTRQEFDQLEAFQELEARAQRQKEESDAIIFSLKASQRELIDRVQDLELQLKEAGGEQGTTTMSTPSLGNSAARARSEAHRQPGRALLDTRPARREEPSQALRQELEEKNARLRALQQEHVRFTESLKLQMQDKAAEPLAHSVQGLQEHLQRALLHNLDLERKLETQSAAVRSLKEQGSVEGAENEKLTAELAAANRQLQVLRAQVAASTRTRAADERRLATQKDQERQWRSGYESLYEKYTQLKEQSRLAQEEVRRLEAGHQAELQALTKKAEGAIRFFKEVALQRTGAATLDDMPTAQALDSHRDLMSACLSTCLPRARSRCLDLPEAAARESRYSRGTCTESKAAAETFQTRSRSVNSPQAHDPVLIRAGGLQHYTRGGPATPLQDASEGSHSRNATLKSNNPYHRVQKTSQSPLREYSGLLPPELGTLATATIQSKSNLSPRHTRKLQLLDKLQAAHVRAEGRGPWKADRPDPRLPLALQAVEEAFSEIAGFKQQCAELSSKYLQQACSQVQDLQVLGFDYTQKLDSFLARESELEEQLDLRAEQMSDLKDLVFDYQRQIEQLQTLLTESKTLKELQWKNIIEYDQVKNKQRSRLGKTVKEESAFCRQLIQSMCAQLLEKENEFGQSLLDYEVLERQKICIENELNQLKNEHEETVADRGQMLQDKRRAEARLAEVEQAIYALLEELLGPEKAAGVGQVATDRKHTAPTQNTLHKGEFVLDEEDSREERHTPRLSTNLPHLMLSQQLKRQDNSLIGPKSLQWLDQIRQKIESLQFAIEADQGHLAVLEGILEGQVVEQQHPLKEILFEDQSHQLGNSQAYFGPQEFTLNEGELTNSRNASKAKGNTNYISSGASSRAQTPERDRPKERQPTIAQFATNKPAGARNSQTQSLESFVRHHAPTADVRIKDCASSDHKHFAANLSEYVRQVQQSPNQEVFENLSQTQTFDSAGPHKLLGKVPLEQKLLGLLESNRMKNQVIANMRQEIERLQEEAGQANRDFDEERANLERLLNQIEDEKEQVSNMYEQENKMRQEIELQVEELQASVAALETLRDHLKEEVEECRAKLEQEAIDRQKLEQSATYWQNSFEEIEQDYIQEKAKAEHELSRLETQIEQLQLSLKDSEHRGALYKADAEALQDFKRVVEDRWRSAQSRSIQTNESMETVENAYAKSRQLSMENERIKKELQTIAEYYGSNQAQAQRSKDQEIHQLKSEFQNVRDHEKRESEKVIGHLNQVIKSANAAKQKAEEERWAYMQENKQLKLQLQQILQESGQQSAKLNGLQDFTSVVQNLNDQLISQVSQISQRIFSAPLTGNHTMSFSQLTQNQYVLPDNKAPGATPSSWALSQNKSQNPHSRTRQRDHKQSGYLNLHATEPVTTACSPRTRHRISHCTFKEVGLPPQSSSARFEEQQNAQIQKNCEMLDYLKQLEESLYQEKMRNENMMQDMTSFRNESQVLMPKLLAKGMSSSSSQQHYFNENSSEALPHDCQQCAFYVNNIEILNDYVRRLLQSFFGTLRQMTAACLEGSVLIKIDKKSPGRINSNNRNGSIEKKTQIIRSAHKFLQKDIKKFMNPNYPKQERLFRFMKDIGDISSELIQRSCDFNITHQKGAIAGQRIQTISSGRSLTINDYRQQNNKGTQTRSPATLNKGCQTDLQLNTTSSAYSRFQETIQIPEIHNEIDGLGASLDSKIGDFVKMLSLLKQHGTSRTLIGTVSKIIHELTEDTRRLADIKARLEVRSGETWRQGLSYEEHPLQYKVNGMYPVDHSSICFDLPLQQNQATYVNADRLNFVNEDGNSESVSKNQTGRVVTDSEFNQTNQSLDLGMSSRNQNLGLPGNFNSKHAGTGPINIPYQLIAQDNDSCSRLQIPLQHQQQYQEGSELHSTYSSASQIQGPSANNSVSNYQQRASNQSDGFNLQFNIQDGTRTSAQQNLIGTQVIQGQNFDGEAQSIWSREKAHAWHEASKFNDSLMDYQLDSRGQPATDARYVVPPRSSGPRGESSLSPRTFLNQDIVASSGKLWDSNTTQDKPEFSQPSLQNSRQNSGFRRVEAGQQPLERRISHEKTRSFHVMNQEHNSTKYKQIRAPKPQNEDEGRNGSNGYRFQQQPSNPRPAGSASRQLVSFGTKQDMMNQESSSSLKAAQMQLKMSNRRLNQTMVTAHNQSKQSQVSKSKVPCLTENFGSNLNNQPSQSDGSTSRGQLTPADSSSNSRPTYTSYDSKSLQDKQGEGTAKFSMLNTLMNQQAAAYQMGKNSGLEKYSRELTSKYHDEHHFNE